MALSNSEIDRLGERLRDAKPTEADLKLLDEYRASFSVAYAEVVQQLRHFGLEPTGRQAKTTESIVAKLKREASTRLSQIQDIAGCRVIVEGISAQDELVSGIYEKYDSAKIFDRRIQPSHGYRAVHVVVRYQKKAVEIQVRTKLQHLWAEVSEKYSDVIAPEVKYGGGPKRINDSLRNISEFISRLELKASGETDPETIAHQSAFADMLAQWRESI